MTQSIVTLVKKCLTAVLDCTMSLLKEKKMFSELNLIDWQLFLHSIAATLSLMSFLLLGWGAWQ